MNFTGKQTDVIDFGGEADYANMQWFQEPAPQRPQVCLACQDLSSCVFLLSIIVSPKLNNSNKTFHPTNLHLQS